MDGVEETISGREFISLENLKGVIQGLSPAEDQDLPDLNIEYNRALVELFCEASGRSMDFKEQVAQELGLRLQ